VGEPRVIIGRGHFEHGDKGTNLTRIMKACSQNREDLEAWAREHVGVGHAKPLISRRGLLDHTLTSPVYCGVIHPTRSNMLTVFPFVVQNVLGQPSYSLGVYPYMVVATNRGKVRGMPS
jgi:hypothetical protein